MIDGAWRRCGFGVALALTIAGCGSDGKDRSFELPPGTALDAVRAARVLVVVEASNRCGDERACVPNPASPCQLGEGNTRGLAVYRLGATGLLFSPEPEQRIPTDDNPRRVIVHPSDPSLLYVATERRIQVFRLVPGAAAECLAETTAETEVDDDFDDLDAVDLVIDPSIGDGILYVAARGANRVDAYTIAPDGRIPALPSSCIVGTAFSQFAAIAPVSNDFFATGGRTSIEIYPRADGQFPPPGDFFATPTVSPTPTASPTSSASPSPSASPSDGEFLSTPTPELPTITGTPTPAPTCIGAINVSAPVSSVGAAIVTDVLFAPSSESPIGALLVAEEVSRRLFTFPVDAAGEIDDNDTSSTKRDGVHERLLRRDRGGESILYASVFNEGRVDVFHLEDGLLPQRTFSRTAEDPDALPVGLAIDEPDGTILWVAQGGLGRVDGFRIRADGSLENLPVTSTRPLLDNAGVAIDTFPDDVAVVPLP